MASSTDKGRETAEAPGKGAAGVVVLGPGRSGTSAIASAFVAAGFFAGEEEDLYGPDRGNPLGHFEPLSVLEVNEELLKRFGCDWWADAPPPEEQFPYLAEAVPRLEAVVDGLIASAGGAPVVVKEPRINGLLPLWQPVIEDALHPVLAVRDPLEVALSHSDRDATSTSHALAAWELQSATVLRWLDGRTATIAPFAQLTDRPEAVGEVVRDAAAHLEPVRARRTEPGDAISVMRPDLCRQNAADLARGDYLTERQAALWRYLSSLPVGDAQLDVPAEIRDASAASRATARRESERVRLLEAHAAMVEEAAKASEHTTALLAHIAEVERRLAETTALAHREATTASRHERELAGVRNSASWRLTAPLRHLKHVLRRTA